MKLEKVKLKDIATFINGRAYKQEEFLDNGKYKVLRVGNFFTSNKWYYSNLELNDDKYCYKGDLLYAWSAKFGPMIWDGDKSIYHYHIWKIVPKNVNKLYLYYLLSFITDSLKKEIHGSVLPHLTKSDMESYEVAIINDLEIQNKIGKFLFGLDKKIKLNSHINDNLYEIIKVQYNNFMSNLIEYDLIKLKDIAIISSGKRPKNKGKEYKIPLIGANGIMSYTDDYNSDSDILVIGRVGTLGVVQRYFDKVWLSDNTISIKTEYMNTLENYLKYVDYQSLNRGSTQPLITQMDISNLKIKFNKNEFVKYEKEIKEPRKKIELNNKQSKVLEKLRNTLLPKLLKGEIDLDKIRC